MKKTTTVGRSSVKKAKGVPKNSSEYLATVPIPARKNLVKLHDLIRSTVPSDAIETISYRIPAFKAKSGVLIWFAGFSDHCSLFPTASVIEMFKAQLRTYSTSKGTIHFPLNKQLPTALIKKIVKARVAQAKGRRWPFWWPVKSHCSGTPIHPRQREKLMEFLSLIESEPCVRGTGAHLIAVARRLK